MFNPCDIDYVNEALPDFVGFVFAESKRRISFETARKFKSRLSPEIKAVGVFVNSPINDIISICEEKTIDLIQLHGEEDFDYIAKLKKHCNIPIIKSANIESTVKTLKSPENADFILFDNGKGGTGKAFDWRLIPKVNKPVFLAGGLNLSNIEEALKLNPYCIDLSSGAETNGVKDKEKILKLVKAVRNYNLNCN